MVRVKLERKHVDAYRVGCKVNLDLLKEHYLELVESGVAYKLLTRGLSRGSIDEIVSGLVPFILVYSSTEGIIEREERVREVVDNLRLYRDKRLLAKVFLELLDLFKEERELYDLLNFTSLFVNADFDIRLFEEIVELDEKKMRWILDELMGEDPYFHVALKLNYVSAPEKSDFLEKLWEKDPEYYVKLFCYSATTSSTLLLKLFMRSRSLREAIHSIPRPFKNIAKSLLKNSGNTYVNLIRDIVYPEINSFLEEIAQQNEIENVFIEKLNEIGIYLTLRIGYNFLWLFVGRNILFRGFKIRENIEREFHLVAPFARKMFKVLYSDPFLSKFHIKVEVRVYSNKTIVELSGDQSQSILKEDNSIKKNFRKFDLTLFLGRREYASISERKIRRLLALEDSKEECKKAFENFIRIAEKREEKLHLPLLGRRQVDVYEAVVEDSRFAMRILRHLFTRDLEYFKLTNVLGMRLEVVY